MGSLWVVNLEEFDWRLDQIICFGDDADNTSYAVTGNIAIRLIPVVEWRNACAVDVAVSFVSSSRYRIRLTHASCGNEKGGGRW